MSGSDLVSDLSFHNDQFAFNFSDFAVDIHVARYGRNEDEHDHIKRIEVLSIHSD